MKRIHKAQEQAMHVFKILLEDRRSQKMAPFKLAALILFILGFLFSLYMSQNKGIGGKMIQKSGQVIEEMKPSRGGN